MTTEHLTRAVMAALSSVQSPSGQGNVIQRGQVKNLEVDEDGTARFAFFLASDDPGSLVKDLRTVAGEVDGITSVKVNVQLPQNAPPEPQAQGGPQPGSVPAPTPQPGLIPDVKRVIAVSSGKGGVGKSMVSVNLAAALAKDGFKVGLLDADVYGPNIPLMFGETRSPGSTGEEGEEQILPLEAHGVKLMSIGFMLDPDQPAIMRGPLISGILRQFLEQVAWGSLDYMIVDMPPGTGDAQISLVQTIDLDGAVMVTTPQEVATADVRRGIRMFEKVNTRILGIVENMSGYECPHCNELVEIFGKGGGEALAKDMGLPFLGAVPLDPKVREGGDEGIPTVVGAADSSAGKALQNMAKAVINAVEDSTED